ncbi:MAG: polyhydroxyalkanoic acid system family protein [Pseudomonadota bacterium]|nr:polyhydroxyalkanoic acid system family protein [Pseudomonadota bacterium]
MANIDLQHPHSLPQPAARAAVEQAIARLGAKFGIDYRWEGDTLHFKRTGVDGRIALQPGAVHVTATLGLLFSAMKGTIESELSRMLQERLP